MSDKRRLAALNVIVKAKQHEIDLIGGQLATLRAQQSQVLAAINNLDVRRDTESYSPSLEAQPFVATFLQAIAADRALFMEKLSELEKAAAVLEEQVRERFIEMQTWKFSGKKLSSAIDYETRRLEETQMDEIGNVMFNFRSET